MAELKLNLDGLKIHLDYLENETKCIRSLQSHIRHYMSQIQTLSDSGCYFWQEQLDILKKIEDNIEGRKSFLENIIQTQHILTNQISQKMQDITSILEVIDEEM